MSIVLHRAALPLAVVVTLCVEAMASLSAPDDKGPIFVVHAADGQTTRGPVRSLKADWSLSAGDSTEVRFTPGDWLSLRRDKTKLPPLPGDQHLILVNGDRIPFETARLDGETLFFKHPDLAEGKESKLPLTALSVVWLTAPDSIDKPDQYRRRISKASRTRDQVLLRNGDVLEGVLNGLTAKQVEVEVDKKAVEVTLDKVAAILLGSDIVNALKPKGVFGRVVLLGDGRAAGSRISLASVACTNGKTLEGKTVFGSSLSVPLERVAALDVYQGNAVYLSDLKPSKSEFTSYLGNSSIGYPLVVDGSVENGDLRLGGSTYDKGIGVHSRSRVTYNLAGAYRRFEAVVGLDDETGRDGSARIRTLADGKALDPGADGEVTRKTGPLTIGVSVVGVKELTLEVDFGPRGFVQEQVDWCDARLVK
jgi:hypothetical protein